MLGNRIRRWPPKDLGRRTGAVARRTWALVLLSILCALTPLAEAVPADPLWIAGIYDDADQDEIVGLVTSTMAAELPSAADIGLPIVCNASPGDTHSTCKHLVDSSSPSVRAPPTI